jgi:beta-hydroxylase
LRVLKAWNRTVYYAFKWFLFGALAFVLFWR